jgi:hypothetical protein
MDLIKRLLDNTRLEGIKSGINWNFPASVDQEQERQIQLLKDWFVERRQLARTRMGLPSERGVSE